MTISNESRSRIKEIFEPIALGMGRLGLTPDGADAHRVRDHRRRRDPRRLQLWLVGGLVVFVGGVFDMFDGTLARATGKVSNLGAFMDSTFDRLGEVIVFLGVVAGLQAAGATDVAVLARRRGHGCRDHGQLRARQVRGPRLLARASGMAAVGVMPREIRLVILSLG